MYVKIFSQILDSSIALDRRLRHFFTDLLLLANSDGMVTMTEEAIALRTRATLDEVHWGIAELMKPDPKSQNPENEGRRLAPLEGMGYGWQILNYPFYRKLKTAEDLRAATRERVARWRANHRPTGNAVKRSVTLGNAGNAMHKQREMGDAEESTTSSPSGPGWEVFEHYRGKGHPRTAWTPKRQRLVALRLKEGFSADELKKAIDGYHADPWHCGENPDRKVWLDFDLLLRDASKVERGCGLAENDGTLGKPGEAVVRMGGKRVRMVNGEWIPIEGAPT